MRPKGLEPLAHCLEGSCSIHLSYGRTWFFPTGARYEGYYTRGFAASQGPGRDFFAIFLQLRRLRVHKVQFVPKNKAIKTPDFGHGIDLALAVGLQQFAKGPGIKK